MKKKVLVVGGGIAGILASKIALQQGCQVNLIESSDKVGGLLGRAHQWQDCYFDYGTHFITSTGDRSVDELCFGEQLTHAKQWQSISQILAGNYFAHKLNESVVAPDLRSLEPALYQRICYELLHTKDNHCDDSLYQRLLSSYGISFAEEVINPLVLKFYGVDSTQLSSSSLTLLGLNRIVLGSDDVTDRLKNSVFFDEIIAFQHRKQQASNLAIYYPSAGIQDWVDALLLECQKGDFVLQMQMQVRQLTVCDKGIDVVLNNGLSMHYDQIIWSAPLSKLAQLLSISCQKPATELWRRGDLYHFVFDAPFQSNLHYVMCYQADMYSYRVTLYANFNPAKAGFHCTVEVIRSFNEPLLEIEIILSELRKMGLVNGSLLHCHTSALSTGFPVNSLVNEVYQQQLARLINSVSDRISCVGKNATSAFFMKDVVNDIMQKFAIIHD